MDSIIQQLGKKKDRFLELEKELASPDIVSDREKFKKLSKEYSELKGIVNAYDEFCRLSEEKASLEHLLDEEGSESEYAEMARTELDEIIGTLVDKRKELEEMILDEDSAEFKRNVIMEIRAGTGGVEASLFAGDLYNMYTRYCVEKGWKISVISQSLSEMNGIKEIIFSVEGINVFKSLRFESGTHRVQRVPETEASGRIHTSAATVAVLPEAEDVEVDILPQDLKVDTYRASGAGGQHVNVTDSAIRITHLPTGIVVSCQDERSQHKNKAKAMRVLKARVYEKLREEHDRDRSDQRKKQVGSGDRSEKIRTYNFPENRVTDHRINLTIYNLANILEGDLDDLLSGLLAEDRKLRLAQKAGQE